MPTTYTNGLKLPDLGSIDWYGAYKNNIDILDPIVGTVNEVSTNYAPISHNHDASEITSGTIDIARLPPAALERMHIVANQAARYALTTDTVQNGDTVKQSDTGVMYLVVDSTKLNNADGYTEYSAGTAAKATADADGNTITSTYATKTELSTLSDTVGTKANDSDVVHKTGDETTTGFKQFANIRVNNSIKAINLDSTTTDLDNCYSDFAPYAESKGGNIQYYYCNTDSGTVNISNLPEAKAFFLTSITTRLISNSLYVKQILINSTSKTFTRYCANSTWSSWINETDSEYVHKADAETITGAKTFSATVTSADVVPSATDTYSLGSASVQYNGIYGKSYYYNGVAWGLDIANEWTGNNVFSGRTTITASSYGVKFYLRNSAIDLSVSGNSGISSTSTQNITWADTDYDYYGRIQGLVSANASTLTFITSYWADGSTQRTTNVYLQTNSTGNYFNPGSNASVDLGTSTNKWKTLNGINPGALSLPNPSYTTIDTSEWDKKGATNTYTPTLDGWLHIRATGCTLLMVRWAGWAFGDRRRSDTATDLDVTIPIRVGINVEIGATCSNYTKCCFYPCQGNV